MAGVLEDNRTLRPESRPPAASDRATPHRADSQAAADTGPFGSSYRLLTVGLLLTVAAWAFEALAVATILPATVDDLGGLRLYGWVFGAFMLTNVVGVAVAGGEVNRVGLARPFAVGIALFIVGLLIGGAAPTMAVLIGGRAVQGLGSGILGSVAYAVVARGYPESTRPRMLALMSSAWVIPGLIGPALSGVIADTVGWRWVFLGIVPAPIVAFALAADRIRRIPVPGAAGPRDWSRIRDAAQLAVGLAVFLAGLGRGNLLLAVPLVAIGAIVAVPPLRRLLPPGTARAAPGPAAAIAVLGLVNLAFFGIEAFVPLALTDIRDRSTSFAGLALTAATITWAAGSWMLDRLARRTSRRSLVQVGLSLIAVGMVGVTLVLVPGTPVLIVPLAWGVAGLGIGLAYSTVQLVVLETAPAGQEGTATAGMQLANTVGIALATGIGGVLIAAFSTGDEVSRTSLAIQDALMIAVVLLALVVAGRLPGRVVSRES